MRNIKVILVISSSKSINLSAISSCRDLGAHIDGFIAVVAHTIIVGASPDKKITGRKADVFLAAYHASQAALRLLKPKTDVSTFFFESPIQCQVHSIHAI